MQPPCTPIDCAKDQPNTPPHASNQKGNNHNSVDCGCDGGMDCPHQGSRANGFPNHKLEFCRAQAGHRGPSRSQQRPGSGRLRDCALVAGPPQPRTDREQLAGAHPRTPQLRFRPGHQPYGILTGSEQGPARFCPASEPSPGRDQGDLQTAQTLCGPCGYQTLRSHRAGLFVPLWPRHLL